MLWLTFSDSLKYSLSLSLQLITCSFNFAESYFLGGHLNRALHWALLEDILGMAQTWEQGPWETFIKWMASRPCWHIIYWDLISMGTSGIVHYRHSGDSCPPLVPRAVKYRGTNLMLISQRKLFFSVHLTILILWTYYSTLFQMQGNWPRGMALLAGVHLKECTGSDARSKNCFTVWINAGRPCLHFEPTVWTNLGRTEK
jgi:hypothetical protein